MNACLSNLISNLMIKYLHYLKHVSLIHLKRSSTNANAVWIKLNLIKMRKFVNFVAKFFVTNAGKRRELSQRKVDHLVVLKSQ